MDASHAAAEGTNQGEYHRLLSQFVPTRHIRTSVNGVHSGEDGKESAILYISADTPATKHYIREDRGTIFSCVDEMRKWTTGVEITTKTLKESPDARQSSKKAIES